MAIWLNRAGADGEFEQKFLNDRRIYVTWEELDIDLRPLKSREQLYQALDEKYPDSKPAQLGNWTGQIWAFLHGMKPGDLVVLPLKKQRAIQIGEITSGYHFESAGPAPYYHWRSVKWVGESIPRQNFSKDLLNSFGALMTICRIQSNNAETRIRAMREAGWKVETAAAIAVSGSPTDETEVELDARIDLEEAARDQIAQLIMARFKGHGLTRLVDAILKAQGYVTYRSPEGADGGADILAGAGPLGFGSPRLCVEVKSEASPIGREAVDKLLGAVAKFGAQEGLFISWSGFKSNVGRELAQSYFRVRLWTQVELLEALFANYERLDEELRAELPLKRIWTVTYQDDE
jgi:restriction system protein